MTTYFFYLQNYYHQIKKDFYTSSMIVEIGINTKDSSKKYFAKLQNNFIKGIDF